MEHINYPLVEEIATQNVIMLDVNSTYIIHKKWIMK